ncbi:MAG: hypothetical protein PHX04_06870 [Bacilli bacterium]|nr:hypothetical protein [Bacilli bacterium]
MERKLDKFIDACNAENHIMSTDEFEYVYCTDCKWFRTDDEELPYCPYEDECNIWGCEDSKQFKYRPHYETKE